MKPVTHTRGRQLGTKRWADKKATLQNVCYRIASDMIKELGIMAKVWHAPNASVPTARIYLTAPEFDGTNTYYVVEQESDGVYVSFLSYTRGQYNGFGTGHNDNNEANMKRYIWTLLHEPEDFCAEYLAEEKAKDESRMKRYYK